MRWRCRPVPDAGRPARAEPHRRPAARLNDAFEESNDGIRRSRAQGRSQHEGERGYGNSEEWRSGAEANRGGQGGQREYQGGTERAHGGQGNWERTRGWGEGSERGQQQGGQPYGGSQQYGGGQQGGWGGSSRDFGDERTYGGGQWSRGWGGEGQRTGASGAWGGFPSGGQGGEQSRGGGSYGGGEFGRSSRGGEFGQGWGAGELGGGFGGWSGAWQQGGQGGAYGGRSYGAGMSGESGRGGYGTSGGYGQGPGFGAEGPRGSYGGMYGSTSRGGEWGAQQQGGAGTQQRSQRNRGPKGYTRSDERIREDISEQLMRHHYIDASEVEVEVQNGEVTLKGTVNERRMKHEIEDLVDDVSGVRDVTNNIRVQRQEQHAGSSQGTWMQQEGQGSGVQGQVGTSATGRQSGGEQHKDKDAESRSRSRGGSTGS